MAGIHRFKKGDRAWNKGTCHTMLSCAKRRIAVLQKKGYSAKVAKEKAYFEYGIT